MNMAIIGAGLSGSYLGKMLRERGHNIEIFESSKKENHWAVCAWAASRNMLSRFSKQAGLNFDDYIYHVGKTLKMDLPNKVREYLELNGLVTYNKQQWEQDLLRDVKITYNRKCTPSNFNSSEYDYVIDCTGMHRTMLPRATEDFLIPAYEYLLENVEGMDEFYVVGYKGARGYFWYFPLDNNRGYMGAGDIDKKYEGIEAFLIDHPKARIVRKIGRPIRLAPPKRMQPFHSGNVIGVGESIGCVFPMLGEGIIPSLICCDIFLDVLEISGPGKFNFEKYSKAVLKRFAYYDDVYRIVRLKMSNKLNMMKHMRLLLSMYRNMKKEESRFGFEVNLDKMTKLVKAL